MLCTTPYTIFMLSCKDGNGLSNYFLQKVVINLYHHVVLWYHLRQFSVSQLFFIIYAVTQTKDFNILKYLPCSLPGKGDQFFFFNMRFKYESVSLYPSSGYMLSDIGYRSVSHSSIEILITFVYQTFYIKILKISA